MTDTTSNVTNVPPARVVFSDSDIEEITGRIAVSLRSGSLTLGANTVELEELFKSSHSVDNAIAVSSGTSALEIVLRALEVSGREVVMPTNTFAATAFAIIAAGATPIFADVDASTMALNVETIEAVLTPNTAAVVLVHIGGLITPEIRAIRALCDVRGIALVEDAAHAHGSQHDGSHAGSFGVAGTFSFYPTKVITSGEGGMIATADDRIADESRIYRDQGKAGFLGNSHVRLGYAWRMSEVHAAIGLVHLRHLEEFLVNRERIANRFIAGLADVDAITPITVPAGSRSSWYKFVALLDPSVDRAELKATLRGNHGVAMSGEVYDTPLHRQPVFESLPTRTDFPVAEAVCAQHVCLPLHSDMSDAEVEHVIASVIAVLPN